MPLILCRRISNFFLSLDITSYEVFFIFAGQKTSPEFFFEEFSQNFRIYRPWLNTHLLQIISPQNRLYISQLRQIMRYHLLFLSVLAYCHQEQNDLEIEGAELFIDRYRVIDRELSEDSPCRGICR